MPVHPVHARMLVDPGLIRVRIVTDGAILANELLGLDLPPSDWPDIKRAEAKQWLDEHFTLAADGKPLTSQLVNASYRLDAWKKVANVGIVGWDGMFIFDLAYSLPAGAAALSGRAVFYEEDWEYIETMLDAGVKPMFQKNFVTHLKIPGSLSMEIGIEKPDFNFPLETAMRSGLLRLLEAAGLGLSLPWPVLYLLFSLTLLIGGVPRLVIGAAAVTALAIFGLGLGSGGGLLLAAPWLALSTTAFITLKKEVGIKTQVAVIGGFSGICMGVGWNSMAGSLALLPINLLTAKIGFIIGSFSGVGFAAGISFFGLKAYRSYLNRESEQMSSKLLEKNGRFLTFGIGAVGIVYAGRALLGL